MQTFEIIFVNFKTSKTKQHILYVYMRKRFKKKRNNKYKIH